MSDTVTVPRWSLTMTEEQGPSEPVMMPCAFCNTLIQTFWAPGNRGMLSGPYVLVADWVFHLECWDEVTHDYRP